jgi:hypothetical protein
LFWCGILVCVAVFFITYRTGVLVELALSIASVTYGGLLGVFLLGVTRRTIRETDALLGFATGIGIMAMVFAVSGLAWTWYVPLGTAISFGTGILSSMMRRKDNSAHS